jgi:30S ribosomal protein S31
MGRGDIKTKRGKIFSGSFGKLRPAKKVKKVVAAVKKKAAAKKKA